jgi:hypothetical protein
MSETLCHEWKTLLEGSTKALATGNNGVSKASRFEVDCEVTEVSSGLNLKFNKSS